MESLTTFFLYSLRFLVIFSAVLLWVVAMSELKTHARKGTFTTVQLASMAVAVSVVAAGTLAALNAAVPSHVWSDSTNLGRTASAPAPAKEECAARSYTFTYSFGLRQPTPRECPAKRTENSLLPSAAGQRTAAVRG